MVSKERARGRAECALGSFELIRRQHGIVGPKLDGAGRWSVGVTNLIPAARAGEVREKGKPAGLQWGIVNGSEITFEVVLLIQTHPLAVVYYPERSDQDWRMLGSDWHRLPSSSRRLWRRYAKGLISGGIRLDDVPVNPFEVLNAMALAYKKHVLPER